MKTTPWLAVLMGALCCWVVGCDDPKPSPPKTDQTPAHRQNQNGENRPHSAQQTPLISPTPPKPSLPADANRHQDADAQAPRHPQEAPVVVVETPPQQRAPQRALPKGYLHFEGACEPGNRITIAAVGDVMAHGEIQALAGASPEQGFLEVWGDVAPRILEADIAYANLETPCAQGLNNRRREVPDPGNVFDDHVYTSSPEFNAPPRMITDLAKTGIDVVSTSNNHALDRGSKGIDRTLDALASAGVSYTGTRHSTSNPNNTPWSTITEAGGFRVAWLACTEYVNGIKDPQKQVLRCAQHKREITDMIRTLKARDDVDAIIVTPHWGREYQKEPDDRQRRYGKAFIRAGATAVIGNHPHVIQPWEKVVTRDGREGLIMYSIGNFTGHWKALKTRTTLILVLGLTRSAKDGTVRINGARFVPLEIQFTKPHQFRTRLAQEGSAAWRFISKKMGRLNRLGPLETMNTTPHCEQDWPAHQVDSKK